MSSELIVTLHAGNFLAADSVVKESLTTGTDVKFGEILTCKEFLQVKNVLKREGEE